jgi:hypothetical protein
VPKFRVTFEDDHAEDFDANNVTYANAGGLILAFNEVKQAKKFDMQQAKWVEGMEVISELQAVLAAPRPDLSPALNWHRVDLLLEAEDAAPENGEAAATAAEEAVRN